MSTITIKASDLKYTDYESTRASGDGPNRGYPDNDLLHRRELYEIITFLENIVNDNIYAIRAKYDSHLGFIHLVEYMLRNSKSLEGVRKASSIKHYIEKNILP